MDLQHLFGCLMNVWYGSWPNIVAIALYIVIPVVLFIVLPVWNAGSQKVKGSIWNTEYDGHNIEVQWLKKFDDQGDCRARYRLYIDDKCVSKDTTLMGDEPEHDSLYSFSRTVLHGVLHGEVLGENSERHIVQCELYQPLWKKRPTKSIIDKIRCTFHVQVRIYVDAKLVYDSFYESEGERVCEEREIERVERCRDEKARREGKEPVFTHRGKKYVRRT